MSELGALYRYDVVRDAGGWGLDEVCHRNFAGGSASTPTLGADGARVYLGDNVGGLIAIDAGDCGEAWSVPLASQIFGSIAAASDGRELYAASAAGVYQVFDDGDHGTRGWTAAARRSETLACPAAAPARERRGAARRVQRVLGKLKRLLDMTSPTMMMHHHAKAARGLSLVCRQLSLR